MSKQRPDLQAAADRLAGLTDEELAAVIARSRGVRRRRDRPDVPAAYPLHAPERSAPTQR
jgi:hypothetical protein